MQALVAVYLLGKLTGKIFFGTLRAAESEVPFIIFTRFVDYLVYLRNLKYLIYIIFGNNFSV